MILPASGGATTLVADAHAAGLKVHPWTFRSENFFLPAELRRGEDLRTHGDHAADLARLGRHKVGKSCLYIRRLADIDMVVLEGMIARSLAWQAPMVDLAGATVRELAAGFAQRTGRRIEVADRALAAVRIGGRLPDDDVEGFVRALEEVYGVLVERRPDGVIVLRNGR